MQLYGLSQKNLILASDAEKGKDYLCPECRTTLRARKGQERQPHFFHLQAVPHCRQHQKGIIHLKLQFYIEALLHEEEPKLEYPFPSIGRIADVACLKSKKIFEIQYSPISLEEAAARCRDYENVGFELIWLLHDHRFNKRKVAAAEAFLRQRACYFTDFDAKGIGLIYDQREILRDRYRLYRGKKIPIDLKKPLPPREPARAAPPRKPFFKKYYSILLRLLLKRAAE
jgi:competence protein CoiA